MPLHQQCENFLQNFDQISEQRQQQLKRISEYLFQKITKGETINLIVICTHNSRRSHIGQLWLQLAAAWYQIENFYTFSGGTEATAFNHRSVAALRRAGFEMVQTEESDNSVYEVYIPNFAENPLRLFSKVYDHSFNPQKDFAAILVCAEAAADCPFVPGAAARFALPFDDPKEYDDSELEEQMYDERVQQIGLECFFILSQVHQNLHFQPNTAPKT